MTQAYLWRRRGISLLCHLAVLAACIIIVAATKPAEEEITLEERVETLEKEMLLCCETSGLPWGADAGLRQLSEIRQGIKDLTVRIELLEALLEKEKSIKELT